MFKDSKGFFLLLCPIRIFPLIVISRITGDKMSQLSKSNYLKIHRVILIYLSAHVTSQHMTPLKNPEVGLLNHQPTQAYFEC